MQGKISLGDMTLYLAIFRQGQTTFQSILYAISNIYENNLFMANFFEFLGMTAAVGLIADSKSIANDARGGIEFRDVGFRYPDNGQWALRDINLIIRPGEKIALVGHNGAGKTTLIKLLSRLYDPTEGSILIDGIDIRDPRCARAYTSESVLSSKISCAIIAGKENIGFGQIDALTDMDRIIESARKSGADTMIEVYRKIMTPCSAAGFMGGTNFPWAMAEDRFGAGFYARCGDSCARRTYRVPGRPIRYEIFRHFQELTEGKMAILISHRFSTVRMADRIAVIEGGAISEIGGHQELVDRKGTYARLFSMQAEGYR